MNHVEVDLANSGEQILIEVNRLVSIKLNANMTKIMKFSRNTVHRFGFCMTHIFSLNFV